jgi:hypothetical protein
MVESAVSEHSLQFDQGSDYDTQISNSDENELAEIRVRTMYNLVEEIKLEAGAMDSVARVLYLTNMQAQMFSVETVPKMMQAFEVKKASLVINLLYSAGAELWNESYWPEGMTAEERREFHGLSPHTTAGPEPPFLSNREQNQLEMRLTMFFKDVLLPLAAETNAIVLCDANVNCALSKTLADTLPLFVAKYGGVLPFTLFGIGAAPNWSERVFRDPSSSSAELAHRSKNWRKGFAKLEAVNNRDTKSVRRLDLQQNLKNYLVIECVSGRVPDRWRDDRSALAAFQNTLLQALSSQLPTVCMRTAGSNLSMPLSVIVEIAGRKIPTLLFDGQDRTAFSEAVGGGQNLNRDALIEKAIESDRARNEALWAKGTIDAFDLDRAAFFYDVLNGDGDQNTVVSALKADSGGNSGGHNGTLITLSQSIEMAEERTRTGAGKPYTQTQVTKVIEHVLDMLAESRFRVLPIAEQEKLKENDDFSPRDHFAVWLRPIWSIYYDIFQSPNIYGANLKNLE